MEIKYKYENYDERKLIEENNKHLFLIREEYLLQGDYLVFSDKKNDDINLLPSWESEVCDKISILTEENENLKQELALTQDAVNEILFMMMNMEVK